MDRAERHSAIWSGIHAVEPIVSHCPPRLTDLAEEIDRLRKALTETFLREHSLIAGSVIELSLQLDQKINEYMKHAHMNREGGGSTIRSVRSEESNG